MRDRLIKACRRRAGIAIAISTLTCGLIHAASPIKTVYIVPTSHWDRGLSCLRSRFRKWHRNTSMK